MAAFSSPLRPLLLFSVCLSVMAATVAASIGVNYGQIADNLPTPDRVIPLVKSLGAARVKLYDADPRVLHAFAGTGIQFTIGLPNELLPSMRDPSKAQSWVETNVRSYVPRTNITCVTVGNEVLTSNDTVLIGSLLVAMENVQKALVGFGLDKVVGVTTAHSLVILETSYPPSAGRVKKELADCVSDVLDFHERNGSPFLINAYPFFAYKGNPKQVPLDFVLFEPNHGMVDQSTNLHYDNMLFAQIDAVYSALAALGHKKVPVQISETGWPSKGDEDETGATPENAKKYNGNLIKVMTQKKGTPMRPDAGLNIYVFALFNENLKPGPTSERNYGLFRPDGSPAYSLMASGSDHSNVTTGVASSGKSTGPYAVAPSAPHPQSTSSAYLSISSGEVGLKSQVIPFIFGIALCKIFI
ncbi:hypothetical protein MLD38_037501 [Melastoma candidum]|uniref:Uncharacterized protein n=1 Tax=Melastoma candidum TaxID=119954 RepID=A0ACB9LMX1_9MYRT|nr:hypothetical protein MLD38_037501 [Melastoma candidum]